MAKRVYAYALEGSADDLRRWADAHLGNTVSHWVADPAKLEVGEGLPPGWRDQGALFNKQGELRWWRREDVYEALLIKEEPTAELIPLSGSWQAEIQSVFLQNLQESRVNPSSTTYPTGNPAGKIEVRVCYRDGAAIFVSLRQFLQDKGETNHG